jgi:EmrB/QacA subfamily drug resistance transporter
VSVSPVSVDVATPSLLATREGKVKLAFLCGVGFLDFVGASIVNVALPAIRSDLHFSVQNLQWVLSGYLITYGGFMLLGGRAADLLGRRRVLLAGIAVFGLTALWGGLAVNAGTLVAARLAQGVGAALMLPAALSILTTTFQRPSDRHAALGAWGGIAGLASAVGVFFGGVLTEGPGWRWVLLINVPICVVVFVAAFRLVDPDRPAAPLKNFDTFGAILATGGMLLLVYALVKAPDDGWGSARTIGELACAGLLLAGFLFNEQRHRNPLAPLSIFRIQGLAAANAAQVIAMAGFYSVFFFLTLYMQNVLGYTEIKGGSAYLPVTFGVVVSSVIASALFSRVGTRPIIVTGALLASGAVFWLSRISVQGSYPTDLLPPLVLLSFGLGAVFVGVTTAANAGVPAEQAGLAAALINSSTWIGGALGLAIFSAIATARTNHLLAAGSPPPEALTSGFRYALFACGVFLAAAALIALRARNTRGEPAQPAIETAEVPEVTTRSPALDDH